MDQDRAGPHLGRWDFLHRDGPGAFVLNDTLSGFLQAKAQRLNPVPEQGSCCSDPCRLVRQVKQVDG